MKHFLNSIKTLFGRVKFNTYLLFWYVILSPEHVVKRTFKKRHGHTLNLKNPQTLNEKLCWMILYDRKREYNFFADKYLARDYFSREFGEEYVIPLLYETKRAKDIRPENISEYPCIVKANHSSAQWQIIRDPKDVDWKKLRSDCRYWLTTNWYNHGKEYQYKYIERRIIVEKLLQTKDGKIPNDYKLHFINGKIAFIYVSVDREGGNYRCIYDKDWNKLPFVWVESWKYREGMNSADVERPATLEKMIEMGTKIAQRFPRYIRVDYYDVDGKLYFGEITFHHGGAQDQFFPKEYDLFYGKQLTL